MEEIDLLEYIAIMKKRFWIILLVMLISISGSVYLNYFYITPTYQATTTMIISKRQAERELQYNDMLLFDKLANNYKELIKSRKVVEQVILQLNLDMDYVQFLESSSIVTVPNTQILKIAISHHMPIEAARIANTYAQIFSAEAEEIFSTNMIEIIDQAVIPYKPVSPKPLINISIAAVLGFMVGLFLAFLVDFFDKSISTPEDIQRHFSLPVLGSIPVFKKK